MSVRLSTLFAIALLGGALCACGGGNNGVAAVPPPVVTPQPTGTPNPHPVAAGDAFSYAGALSERFIVYGTPAPASGATPNPAPTSTPWVSTSALSVQQSTSISPGATFNGVSGLADFATAETDASANATLSATSHAYVAFVPDATRANGADATLAGTQAGDSNGVSVTTSYTAPNQIFDEMPEVPNAQWSNSAARVVTELDPDGQKSTTTYAGDGSYGEQLSYPEGESASVQASPDGSGVYQTPVVGLDSTNSALSVAAPSGGNIQIFYQIYGAGLPEAGTFTIPDWYPSTPPVLATDAFVDAGTTSLPASCGTAKAYASPVVQKLVETTTRVDTVFGQLETRTQTSYLASPYGVLCSVLHDDLVTYYDFSGQSGGIFAYSPTPLEEQIVDETVGLQTAKIAASASSRRSRSAASNVATMTAFPSFAHAAALIHLSRAKRARVLSNALHTRRAP